jgi:ribosomal protein RSM22 (predicted rRNA methylase)
MELPPALREAVDRALEGVSAADLARAASSLSQRYRAETLDGRWHVASDLAARAYLATRLPATFAAVRAAMDYAAEAQAEFSPQTMLDVGAGPGTAMWAAKDCWPDISAATMVEGSAQMRNWGETLAHGAGISQIVWHGGDANVELSKLAPHDLVTLAYVLSELPVEAQDKLVEKLWALTADTLLIVEPGTPAGWSRILRARDVLIHNGAHVIAPCPHASACPLEAPDWCHFARRVSRSRVHRLAKGAEVPWEDEKYIYVAVSRHTADAPQARIVAPPQQASGQVRLKLCQQDGSSTQRLITRREGDAYKSARRLEWGDPLR